eukprot:7997888-Karenia_brevis.AAC.1
MSRLDESSRKQLHEENVNATGLPHADGAAEVATDNDSKEFKRSVFDVATSQDESSGMGMATKYEGMATKNAGMATKLGESLGMATKQA